MRRIDAHHHLWRYSAKEYDWIDDGMQVLRRDFLMEDLDTELAAAHVDLTIAVQARQTLEETAWLLQTASQAPKIAGVVGWAPIASIDFSMLLNELCADSHLKGLRHVVQAEPIGFLDDAAFNAGITAVTSRNLVYDLLIKVDQLPEAIRFADRHPHQILVVDHMAKPDIAGDELAPWAHHIRELARRENVACKVSGLVTEADWTTWKAEDLKPYFNVVLESFGASRLMAGSDWPVLQVACDYGRWWKTLESWTAPLSRTEQDEILGGVAERIYHIEVAPQARGGSA
jgi:L-fuconolactonase